MKIGLSIASLIVLAIVGLLVLKQREPIDHATNATTPQKLQVVGLDASELPVIFTAESGRGNGGQGFDTLLGVADRVGPKVTGGEPDQRAQAAEEVCDAIIQAVHGGSFEDGFVDGHIEPGGVFTDPLRKQFRITAAAADMHFRNLMEAAAFEEADVLARAQFELGRRVMMQNVRLRGRQRGLGLMRTGLAQIAASARAMHQEGALEERQNAALQGDVEAWQQAIDVVEAAWKEKLAVISSAKPNVADLIRVAELDEDRTFRVFATHQLGYARYERGESGNQRIIAEAIARACESDDKLIKAAGIAAGSMTREQFHTSER